MSNSRNLLFAQILQSRLESVDQLLDKEIEFNHENSDESIDDEECLRKLMVNIIPKIKCKNPDLKKVELFFSYIARLKEKSLCTDYRFLDAWNHGFESIILWQKFDDKKSIELFLNEYKKILHFHIDYLRQN